MTKLKVRRVAQALLMLFFIGYFTRFYFEYIDLDVESRDAIISMYHEIEPGISKGELEKIYKTNQTPRTIHWGNNNEFRWLIAKMPIAPVHRGVVLHITLKKDFTVEGLGLRTRDGIYSRIPEKLPDKGNLDLPHKPEKKSAD